MKSINLFISFLLVTIVFAVVAGCTRVHGCTDAAALNYNANAKVNNGSCQYNGHATFYFNQTGAAATVKIGSQTETVSTSYPLNAPVCGTNAVGCANFTLPEGSYAYTASSATASWGGNVVVGPNICTEVLLNQHTGSLVFWMSTTIHGGIIVKIGNGSGTIFDSIPSTPTCGYNGCVTFNLGPGLYNYMGYGTLDSAVWSGSAMVVGDSCKAIQIQ